MDSLKLCESDYRFMTVIWDYEPLPSGKLVKLCTERLGWKKSTTYTTLKKLCLKGFAQNDCTIVTSLVPRADVQQFESTRFVNRAFNGSLPQFLNAFLEGKTLTKDEADELRGIIDKAQN